LQQENHLFIFEKIPNELPKQVTNRMAYLYFPNKCLEHVNYLLKNKIKNRHDLKIIDLQKLHLNISQKIISYADSFDKKMFSNNSIRSVFKNLVSNDYLNLFWTLQISEKSSFRGKFYQRLFQVLIIKKLLKLYKIQCIITNQPFSFLKICFPKKQILIQKKISHDLILFKTKKLLILIQFLRNFLSVILTKLLVKIFIKKQKISTNSNKIFTIFPNWWTNSNKNVLRERFFPNGFTNKENDKTGYVIWVSLKKYGLITTFKILKKISNRYCITVLQSHLNFKDICNLNIFKRMFFIFSLCRKSINLLVPKIENINVNKIYYDDFYDSLCKGNVFSDFLLSIAIKKLCNQEKVENIFFRFENQPIDHALIAGIESRCCPIGFWHAVNAETRFYLPLNLNFRYLNRQKNTYFKKFPKKFLVNNNLCKNNLIKQGIPVKNILFTYPLRSWDLIKSRKTILRSTKKSNYKHSIFVSFSVSPDENFALLYNILEISCFLKNFRIFIKQHPAALLDISEISKIIKNFKHGQIKVLNDQNMFWNMSKSEAVISGGSSIVFEALLLNKTPIVYENPNLFNQNSLLKFKNSLFLVKNSKELQKALISIFEKKKSWQRKIDNGKKLLPQIFPKAA
jgi:hypothetical protein